MWGRRNIIFTPAIFFPGHKKKNLKQEKKKTPDGFICTRWLKWCIFWFAPVQQIASEALCACMASSEVMHEKLAHLFLLLLSMMKSKIPYTVHFTTQVQKKNKKSQQQKYMIEEGVIYVVKMLPEVKQWDLTKACGFWYITNLFKSTRKMLQTNE